MRRSRYLSLLTVTFLTVCIVTDAPVSAQVLSGVVLNDKSEPLKDAHVRVANSEIQTVTADDGSFALDNTLLLGNESDISLTITRIGYRAEEVNIPYESIRDDSVTIRMKPAVYDTETVVITATRTLRDIEEVSIPISVVPGDEIRNSGSMRLSDVLSEQTGMQIVSDHGTGIQVQGFDPDYTLIMIDGNPVIGRTAGTLDLSRMSVRDVEQIEIVKGPSSALWGSDALAGVVNIITNRHSQPFTAGFTGRYGENNTLDLNGDLSLNTKSWKNKFFANRNSSTGYKLNPNSVSQTVPEYENYTLRYNTRVELTDNLSLDGNVRYFTESQQNRASVTDDGEEEQLLELENSRTDLMINPSISYSPFSRFDLNLDWLYSRYGTESIDELIEAGEMHSQTTFNQTYSRPELQAGYRWNNRHHSLTGGGLIQEGLEAERYPGQPDFKTTYLYTQHSWTPAKTFELTGGFRFDAHSEYASQFSPKLSARYKMNDWLQFRASAGRGFKAPEFRQLFLDFTNSTAGYSVFGSSTVTEGLQRYLDEGTISEILIPLDNLDEIRAESSWAVNLGFDVDPWRSARLRLNLFRNHVSDLIETAPIAQRTNGQSVFTYFNVDEVITQGVETEFRFRVWDRLNSSVGYQFLKADRKIERERTVQNDEGEVVEVREVNYRPMFNRSKHSGNVKLFYESGSGWGANIRGMLRGRFGLADSNGNGYVNENEYENGYTLWNAAISKKFEGGMTFQTGIDNLFGYTNSSQPNLSGRLWYAQVSVEF